MSPPPALVFVSLVSLSQSMGSIRVDGWSLTGLNPTYKPRTALRSPRSSFESQESRGRVRGSRHPRESWVKSQAFLWGFPVTSGCGESSLPSLPLFIEKWGIRRKAGPLVPLLGARPQCFCFSCLAYFFLAPPLTLTEAQIGLSASVNYRTLVSVRGQMLLSQTQGPDPRTRKAAEFGGAK